MICRPILDLTMALHHPKITFSGQNHRLLSLIPSQMTCTSHPYTCSSPWALVSSFLANTASNLLKATEAFDLQVTKDLAQLVAQVRTWDNDRIGRAAYSRYCVDLEYRMHL